ncbi:hypothetical protein PMIN02_002997 [Paraphaeosphaeria minitans]
MASARPRLSDPHLTRWRPLRSAATLLYWRNRTRVERSPSVLQRARRRRGRVWLLFGWRLLFGEPGLLQQVQSNNLPEGCTRREYDSSNCPRKCDTDQKKADWVGVIYCNGTNGTPKDTWVCQHPDNCYAPATNCPLPDTASWDTGLEITRTTRCENIQHDKKWVAFENKLNIKTTVSLPQPSYVSAWWDAHSNYSTRWHQEIPHSQEIPYTSTRPTDSTLNATSSASGSSGPTSSNNSTTLLPEGTSASNGSKIGMAVGLGLGTPLLLAILGFLIFFLRKRRNGGDDGEQPWSGTQSGDGAVENEKVHGSTGETYDYSAKAELPADERPAPVPEMEGSSIGIVSLLLPKDSGKEDVRDHGDDKAPVYELPG